MRSPDQSRFQRIRSRRGKLLKLEAIEAELVLLAPPRIVPSSASAQSSRRLNSRQKLSHFASLVTPMKIWVASGVSNTR
jgi:hypothetical protein